MAIIVTMKNNCVMPSVRRLKVYEKIVVYNTGPFGGNSVSHHPEIRLIGKWLADCGFQPGQYVDVTIGQGKLIITHNSEHVEVNNEGVKTLC
ncbi:MAG TPA: SymE family type I addiction module toxin [Niabella sp.]